MIHGGSDRAVLSEAPLGRRRDTEVPIQSGGPGGIRTLGALVRHAPLAKVCFRPLSHRSSEFASRGGRLHTAGEIRQPSRGGNLAVFRRLELSGGAMALCRHALALAARPLFGHLLFAFRGREEGKVRANEPSEIGRKGGFDAVRGGFRADRGLRSLESTGRWNAVGHWE